MKNFPTLQYKVILKNKLRCIYLLLVTYCIIMSVSVFVGGWGPQYHNIWMRNGGSEIILVSLPSLGAELSCDRGDVIKMWSGPDLIILCVWPLLLRVIVSDGLLTSDWSSSSLSWSLIGHWQPIPPALDDTEIWKLTCGELVAICNTRRRENCESDGSWWMGLSIDIQGNCPVCSNFTRWLNLSPAAVYRLFTLTSRISVIRCLVTDIGLIPAVCTLDVCVNTRQCGVMTGCCLAQVTWPGVDTKRLLMLSRCHATCDTLGLCNVGLLSPLSSECCLCWHGIMGQ